MEIADEVRSIMLRDLQELHAFVQRRGLEPIEEVIVSSLGGRLTRLSGKNLEKALTTLIGASGARLLLYCLYRGEGGALLNELASDEQADTVYQIAHLIAHYGKPCFRALMLEKYGADYAPNYDLFISRDVDGAPRSISISFYKLEEEVEVRVTLAPEVAAHLGGAISREVGDLPEGENCDGKGQKHSIGF